MKNRIIILALILALLVPSATMFAQGQQAAATKVVEARLASEEVEGDFMTVWANNFADYMREETNDAIDITVFPYGTIGSNRDIN